MTKRRVVSAGDKVPKPFVICDPVHGYLRIAAHERIVIDHSVTQRLRRVAQTGMADLVFPEARTSRFIHSLGAMHLASRFLLSAIENADDKVALGFFSALREQARKSAVSLNALDQFLVTDGVLGGGGLAAARVSFRHKVLRKHLTEYRRLLGWAEAGLRLAALFHDLGHLPFSHDLEFALKDFMAAPGALKGQRPASVKTLLAKHKHPHEEIGHRLSELVLSELIENETKSHVWAAYSLAIEILNAEPGTRAGPVTALGFLHSLMDSDVDVDRADYLLRDGRALGLDFANYDLERLLQNVVLVQDGDAGFAMAIDEHGLSSLESFFLSRARSSRVLIRHHKVAEVAAALRFASVHVLSAVEGQTFLRELGFLVAKDRSHSESLLDRFARYDDPFWIQCLRSLSPSKGLLRDCLHLILHRKPTLSSAWKREGDFTETDLKKVNEVVDSWMEKDGKFRYESVRATLRNQGILLVRHAFKPYVTEPGGDSVVKVKTSKGLSPASTMSPLLASLGKAWNAEIHLHAFGVGDSARLRAVVLRGIGV